VDVGGKGGLGIADCATKTTFNECIGTVESVSVGRSRVQHRGIVGLIAVS